MSEKRKGGASRQREKNKKCLVAAAGSSSQNIVNMFKKVENNLVKSIVSTYYLLVHMNDKCIDY